MNGIIPFKRTYGILLFGIGILLGTFLAAVLTWANLEAAFYVFQYLPGEPFDGLICPALMTSHETGTILIDVHNPSKEIINPIIRVDVSAYGMPDTRQVQLIVQPGETRQIEEPVTADNIALGYFILAKVYRYIAFPLPEANATCGTFIIDVTFLKGMQIFNIWLAFTLVFIPLGLWMWSSSLQLESAARILNPAKALAVIVLGGLLFGINGVWVLGVLFLALTLLMFAAVLQFVTLK